MSTRNTNGQKRDQEINNGEIIFCPFWRCGPLSRVERMSFVVAAERRRGPNLRCSIMRNETSLSCTIIRNMPGCLPGIRSATQRQCSTFFFFCSIDMILKIESRNLAHQSISDSLWPSKGHSIEIIMPIPSGSHPYRTVGTDLASLSLVVVFATTTI